MKKFGFILIVAALMASVLEGCDFLIGPDEPAGSGDGNLVISFERDGKRPTGRAITSGADLPGEVIDALHYELALTGPAGEVLAKTVANGENVSLTVALGAWRIDVRAYHKEDGLAGTQSVSLMVGPGVNSVSVPMEINGGYFDIAVDSAGNGTVRPNFDAAFPETTITLTVTPEAGYALKSGTVKYRYGGNDYTPAGSGSTYSFTMPAADVTVSAVFNPVLGGITIEGPQDEAVGVTPVHSSGHTPPTTISRAAGESVTFTLDSSGHTQEAGNLMWFVQGTIKTGTGNSLTINAGDYVERKYSLTVMIKLNDNQWYSADSGFTVAQ